MQQKLVPSRLIKYDQEANTAARGEDGFCTPVRTGELDGHGKCTIFRITVYLFELAFDTVIVE